MTQKSSLTQSVKSSQGHRDCQAQGWLVFLLLRVVPGDAAVFDARAVIRNLGPTLLRPPPGS